MPYSYEVNFVKEDTLKEELTSIKANNKNKHFVFMDENVANLYGRSIFTDHETFKLIAEEDNKVLPVATTLLDKLQEKNFTKNETFLSAGGGITQDLSAFARAVYKRGINWFYMPTTLLAMADSCIGAKSCLNYGGVKNQLGLFSAPHKVYIYDGFLNTLPHRDVLSGYGEIIKLIIVGGETAINKLISLTKDQNNDKLKNIHQLIMLSLLIKKSVIEIDEFEVDIRKALNYGHTIGHAIEPLVNYTIPHGIAISIGMYIENIIASEYGTLPKHKADYLNSIIKPFIDSESINYLKDLSLQDIIKNMKRDKKALSDDVYMAVPLQIGNFNILKVSVDDKFENCLGNAFKELSN
jgi:3-dehydroquinate synthase